MSKQAEATRVINVLRPRTTESIVSVAKALEAGETPNLHQGVIPKQQYLKQVQEHVDALSEGKKAKPLPNLYQPVIMAAVAAIGAVIAVIKEGRVKRQPKFWNENHLGKWDGNGDIIDARSHHVEDVHKLIVDPEANVINLGRLGEVIAGTDHVSAIRLVNFSNTGSFSALARAIRDEASKGIEGLENLVGLINNKITTLILEDGSDLVFRPNGIITWGHLYRGEHSRPLTPSQVRGLGDNPEDIKFKPLDEPIRLNNVSLARIISAAKKYMAAASTKDANGLTDLDRFSGRKARSGGKQSDVDKRLADNIGTMNRINPKVIRCNGIKALQIGLPTFYCYEGEKADKLKPMVGIAVGARLPVYKENVWVARRRVVTPEEAVTVAEVEVAPKKAKKAKKATKAKGKKKGEAQVSDQPAEAQVSEQAPAPEVVETETTTA